MKAILPLAGVGSRLRPHTYTKPKPLLPVAGKPILGHILDQLVPIGIKEVVLVVGQFGVPIIEYVQESYPFDVHVSVQLEPKGLGHAIYLTREYVSKDEPALIVLGDTLFRADLPGALARGKSTLGVAEVKDPRSFGVVETDGEFITRLVEKPADPPSNLAIVGIYYLKESRRLFEALDHVVNSEIRSGGEIQLTDALQVMIDRGEEMTTFPVTEWLDCGSPQTLLATNRKLLAELEGPTPEGEQAIFIPPVYVAPTARVQDSVLGPYVSVGDGAVITRSVVRNSIIDRGAEISDIVLSDSIIGERAGVGGHYTRLNVGDSTQINLDFSS